MEHGMIIVLSLLDVAKSSLVYCFFLQLIMIVSKPCLTLAAKGTLVISRSRTWDVMVVLESHFS